MNSLRIRDLAVAPPGVTEPLVTGLSLDLAAGEWLALEGPNGGGKSTLAMVLAGLWPALRGSVEFEGRPLAPGRPPGAREGIAALLQDPSVQLLQSTVADELALAPRNLGRDEAEVAREVTRVADALGLTHRLSCDPAELSAGGQQLTLIAGALTARPRLLVADEPGAHLDREARERVLRSIAAEVARGLAVVWVTQDPDERAAAHRVLSVGAGAAPAGAGAEVAGARGRETAPLGRAPSLVIEVGAPAPDTGSRVCVREPLVIESPASGITALVGANGVGKSVLLAAATGARPVAQVRVLAAPALPPMLATQYPERELFAERVLDEVAWAARQRGSSRADAERSAREWLARVGAPERLAERRVWGLSGGEKRLVQLAGALAAPAGWVALDEPTAGLDPGRRRAVAAAVAWRAREVPLLIASQDLQWLDSLPARRVGLVP